MVVDRRIIRGLVRGPRVEALVDRVDNHLGAFVGAVRYENGRYGVLVVAITVLGVHVHSDGPRAYGVRCVQVLHGWWLRVSYGLCHLEWWVHLVRVRPSISYRFAKHVCARVMCVPKYAAASLYRMAHGPQYSHALKISNFNCISEYLSNSIDVKNVMTDRDVQEFRQEFVQFLDTGNRLIDFNFIQIVILLCDYLGGETKDLRHFKYVHREQSFYLNSVAVLKLIVDNTHQHFYFTCPKFRYALRDPMSLSQPPLAIAKYSESTIKLFMEGIIEYRTSSDPKCFPEHVSSPIHAGWVSESIVQAKPGAWNYASYY